MADIKRYAHFFIKFGKKEFMEKLLYNGEIFMNTVQYYRDHENTEIGDKNEGLTQIPLSNIKRINDTDCFATNIRLQYDNSANKNLFCLFCIENKDIVANLNDKNQYILNLDNYKGFGDYCVVIKYLEPFVDRLTKAIEASGLILSGNKLVRYENLGNYTGAITIFTKNIKYIHQKEYRFLVENTVNESITLNIGSLEEFADIIPIQGNELVINY